VLLGEISLFRAAYRRCAKAISTTGINAALGVDRAGTLHLSFALTLRKRGALMKKLECLIDPRKSTQGKVLCAILAFVLAFSMFNVVGLKAFAGTEEAAQNEVAEMAALENVSDTAAEETAADENAEGVTGTPAAVEDDADGAEATGGRLLAAPSQYSSNSREATTGGYNFSSTTNDAADVYYELYDDNGVLTSLTKFTGTINVNNTSGNSYYIAFFAKIADNSLLTSFGSSKGSDYYDIDTTPVSSSAISHFPSAFHSRVAEMKAKNEGFVSYLGFTLKSGGTSTDPSVWNVYSTAAEPKLSVGLVGQKGDNEITSDTQLSVGDVISFTATITAEEITSSNSSVSIARGDIKISSFTIGSTNLSESDYTVVSNQNGVMIISVPSYTVTAYDVVNGSFDATVKAQTNYSSDITYTDQNKSTNHTTTESVLEAEDTTRATFSSSAVIYNMDAAGVTFANPLDSSNCYSAGEFVSGTTINVIGDVPSRTGYDFKGWKYAGADYAAGDSVVMPQGSSVVFTAQWERIQYAVNYDLNGGDTYGVGAASETVDASETKADTVHALTSTAPSREGYTFAGWALTPGATSADVIDTVVLNQACPEVTVYAVWEKVKYTVSYKIKDDAENTPAAEVVDSGQSVVLPTVTKPGYTLSAWSDGQNTYEAGATFTPTSNVEFSAYWVANAVPYCFRYVLNATLDEVIYTLANYDGTYGDVVDAVDFVPAGYTLVTTNNKFTLGNTLLDNTFTIYCYKNVELVAASDTVLYDGKSHVIEGYATVGALAKFNPEYASAKVAQSGVDAGTYTAAIEGVQVGEIDASKKYIVTKLTNGTLTIEKRKLILISADGVKEYDGTALTKNEQGDVNVLGDGLAEGDVVTFDITGSQTLVGASDNTFTYAFEIAGRAKNYNVQCYFGTLNVTNRDAKYEITVEANSASYTYDADEHTVEGLKQTTFIVDGHTYTVSGLEAKAQGKHAAEYPVNITGTAVVTDEAGNDVTSQFKVNMNHGALVIGKIEIVIQADSATQVYDGTTLTKHSFTIVSGEFVDGEGIDADSVVYEGSQTSVGTSQNVIVDYKFIDSIYGGNYGITVLPGTLTVTAAPYTPPAGGGNPGGNPGDGNGNGDGDNGDGTDPGDGDGDNGDGDTPETNPGDEGNNPGTDDDADNDGTDNNDDNGDNDGDNGNIPGNDVNDTPGATPDNNNPGNDAGDNGDAATPVTPSANNPNVGTNTPAGGTNTGTNATPGAGIPGATATPDAGVDATPVADAEDGVLEVLADAEEAIEDNETPLASAEEAAHANCWVHWFMILGMILTVLYAVVVAARRAGFTGKLNKMASNQVSDR
jgi:uncharacterized repeat protein (TIGR02543 family)